MECSDSKDITKEEETKLELLDEGETAGGALTANQKKKLKKKQKKEAEIAAALLAPKNPTEEKKDEQPMVSSEPTNEDASGDEEEAVEGDDKDAPKKKKKRNKQSKKPKGSGEQSNSGMRLLGSWPANPKQTPVPTIPISQQYEKGKFPEGEILEHPHLIESNISRITNAEKKNSEKMYEDNYDDLRRASEVHRQVRKYAQSFIKPGMKVMDICNEIESTNRRLIEASGLDAGIAFPTGASLNHVAAHWTPNIGDETVLQYGDVMKIDYGSHIKGLMTDCAFTVAFDPTYDNLLAAVKDATNTGIKAAGIDVRLCDIGAQIQETMESYEVTIRNQTFPVKCISNLCGHSIERYRIHAGKSVPIVDNGDTRRMEENEQYAIETFGSTGKGVVYNDVDCSHYMLEFNHPTNPIVRSDKAKSLFHCIKKNFGTLAFCRKWLEEHYPRHIGPLKQLVDAKIVNSYPPLSDIPGCYTAQYEHDILLRPTCKEVITRGPDY